MQDPFFVLMCLMHAEVEAKALFTVLCCELAVCLSALEPNVD